MVSRVRRPSRGEAAIPSFDPVAAGFAFATG